MIRKLNRIELSNVLLIILIVLGTFLIPTFINKLFNLGNYKQIVVGTVVNTSLILTALYINGKYKTLLITVLPSLSTMLSGVLFGGLTYYSKVLIPFIWIGNFFFIYAYRNLFMTKRLNYIQSSVIAIILKVLIIYLGYILLSTSLKFPVSVQETLSVSMSLIQMITATLGALIARIMFLQRK